MNLKMPWKFYFAKTAGMKANFTGFKRNLFSPYIFRIVFISSLPLTPMSIYISAVFTESFQKRDFKISFYIWGMSLACNFITTGNEDRFWALVAEFTLSPVLLQKYCNINNQQCLVSENCWVSACISLCPTKELLYLHWQFAQWWQLVIDLVQHRYLIVIKRR